MLLAGRRGQRSDEEEEEEEGEVDEDEEETVKKSSEEKDSDGEVAKTENKEEDGQVKFTPITPTKIVIRLIGHVISLLIGRSQMDNLSGSERESLLRNELRPAIKPFKGNKLFLRFATHGNTHTHTVSVFYVVLL